MKAFTGRIVLAAVLLGLTGAGAAAGDYVVPPANTNTSGTGGSFTLLTADYTGQQVYSASLMSGLPADVVIDGFRFRLGPGQSTVTSAVTSAHFDVSIGPSAFHAGSLTSSTAGNQGPGTVLARSGPITFPANSFVGGAGPNPWGPLVPFTTAYAYTPGTDLLLTFSDTAFSSGPVMDAQAGLFTNAQGRQNGGVYNSATVPQSIDGFALIVQFHYTPTPEPSAALPAGLALLAGLAFLRRRAGAVV